MRNQLVLGLGPWQLLQAAWEQLPRDAKDFVKSLLTVDPTRRLSTADALRHPWLNQTSETLQRRPGVRLVKALDDPFLRLVASDLSIRHVLLGRGRGFYGT